LRTPHVRSVHAPPAARRSGNAPAMRWRLACTRRRAARRSRGQRRGFSGAGVLSARYACVLGASLRHLGEVRNTRSSHFAWRWLRRRLRDGAMNNSAACAPRPDPHREASLHMGRPPRCALGRKKAARGARGKRHCRAGPRTARHGEAGKCAARRPVEGGDDCFGPAAQRDLDDDADAGAGGLARLFGRQADTG